MRAPKPATSNLSAPRPISSSGVKPMAMSPWSSAGFSTKRCTASMISATPALSSAPSSVVPSLVTMSSPRHLASTGESAARITCAGSPGSTMSPPA